MTEQKRKHIPSVTEIQKRLRHDLDAGEIVRIREGENLHKDPDGRIRRTIGEYREALDESDIRSFLKIAANFMRKQMLRNAHNQGEGK